MAAILAYIAQVVQIANIAAGLYADVKPFLALIQNAATTPNWQPAPADWEALAALEAPLRAQLNQQEPGDE